MKEISREAIAGLARSEDAQRLVKLLQEGGDVGKDARAAAQGKPEQLLERMKQLMSTPEGAQLVERIGQQAREKGLTK